MTVIRMCERCGGAWDRPGVGHDLDDCMEHLLIQRDALKRHANALGEVALKLERERDDARRQLQALGRNAASECDALRAALAAVTDTK